jgi:hypothetical protein
MYHRNSLKILFVIKFLDVSISNILRGQPKNFPVNLRTITLLKGLLELRRIKGQKHFQIFQTQIEQYPLILEKIFMNEKEEN